MCDLFIEGGDAGDGVDDEEDEVGGVDGDADLCFDIIGKDAVFVIAGVDAVAACVDEFAEAGRAALGCGGQIKLVGDSVACDAGGGVDDADAFSREHVEQA